MPRIAYYNQIIQLPIVLSNSYDTTVAFWTTVIPSTSVALAYYFILRPRQRQRRIEYVGYSYPRMQLICLFVRRFFRQARRELRESKADKIRPVEETVSLLRDAAKRHMRAEASIDGVALSLYEAALHPDSVALVICSVLLTSLFNRFNHHRRPVWTSGQR